MKIGKPVNYDGKKYWLADIREAMVGLKRSPDDDRVKWVSRNSVDAEAVR